MCGDVRVYMWGCEELGTMWGVRVTRMSGGGLISNLCPFQVLNEFFHNVCELDLVFNFYKVNNMSILSTLLHNKCCLLGQTEEEI